MNKTMVLEATFNIIRDSLDWAFEVSDDKYAYYVNGVTDLAKDLIDELNKLTEPIPAKDVECDF